MKVTDLISLTTNKLRFTKNFRFVFKLILWLGTAHLLGACSQAPSEYDQGLDRTSLGQGNRSTTVEETANKSLQSLSGQDTAYLKNSSQSYFRDDTARSGLVGKKVYNYFLFDFNNDGYEDIAYLPAPYSHPEFLTYRPDLKMFLADDLIQVKGDRLFSSQLIFEDFDGDQVVDMIAVSFNHRTNLKLQPIRYYQGKRVEIERGLSRLEFIHRPARLKLKPMATSVVLVGDYNYDGRLDLFVGNWFDAQKKIPTSDFLLIGNQNGFAASKIRRPKSAPSQLRDLPTYAAANCDLNSDGFVDIVTVSSDGFPNEVWINQSGKGFKPRSRIGGVAQDRVGHLKTRGGGRSISLDCVYLAQNSIGASKGQIGPSVLLGEKLQFGQDNTSDQTSVVHFVKNISQNDESGKRKRRKTNRFRELKPLRRILAETVPQLASGNLDPKSWLFGDLFSNGKHQVLLDLSAKLVNQQVLEYSPTEMVLRPHQSSEGLGTGYAGLKDTHNSSLLDWNQDGLNDLLTVSKRGVEGKLDQRFFLLSGRAVKGNQSNRRFELKIKGRKTNRRGVGSLIRLTSKDGETVYMAKEVYPHAGHLPGQSSSKILIHLNQNWPQNLNLEVTPPLAKKRIRLAPKKVRITASPPKTITVQF